MTANSPSPQAVSDAEIKALHEALGGDGWAYSNYGGNELSACRDELIAGVLAVRRASPTPPPADAGKLLAIKALKKAKAGREKAQEDGSTIIVDLDGAEIEVLIDEALARLSTTEAGG